MRRSLHCVVVAALMVAALMLPLALGGDGGRRALQAVVQADRSPDSAAAAANRCWVERACQPPSAHNTNMPNFVRFALVAWACLAGRAESASGASCVNLANLQTDGCANQLQTDGCANLQTDGCAVPPVGPTAAAHTPPGSSRTELDTATFVSGASTPIQPFQYEPAGTPKDEMTLAHPNGAPTTSQATAAFGSDASTTLQPYKNEVTGIARNQKTLAHPGVGVPTTSDMTLGAKLSTASFLSNKSGATSLDTSSGDPQSAKLSTAGFLSNKSGAIQATVSSGDLQSAKLSTAGFLINKSGTTQFDMSLMSSSGDPQCAKLSTAGFLSIKCGAIQASMRPGDLQSA